MASRYICPIHNTKLKVTQTRYGPRFDCPEKDCTVVLWGNDETATPADFETRQARRKAHAAFDPLWRKKKIKRQRAYKKLAHYLNLPIEKTHIGAFSKQQCEKVIEFVVCCEVKNGSD